MSILLELYDEEKANSARFLNTSINISKRSLKTYFDEFHNITSYSSINKVGSVEMGPARIFLSESHFSHEQEQTIRERNN